MRYARRISALTALAAIGIAVTAPAASSQSKDEEAIRALTYQWQKDIAARNLDGIVALHAPDAIVMMSHNPLATGTAAIRGAWGEGLKTPGLDLHWTPVKIEVASPTVATEYGSYTESFDTPNGKGHDAGNYVTIWHKINGKWRVALDAPVTTMPLPAAGAASMEGADMQMTAGTSVTWSDLSVPGFDPGAKIAVLHGNPAGTGDYTIRLQFPAGYRFPVHWHPKGEHLTVVSGTFQLAMGNTADWSALRSYAPGDFLYLPAQHAHFGGAQGVTVVQLHGEGPFEIKLGPGK
jgi:ketosteroid isomerase-like protein/quercetin dioxygenase-like cupin family protein